MVKKPMYLKILILKKKGYSLSQISKDLKIDRKTVRKYLKMNETHYRNYIHALKDKDKCFDQFIAEILAVYEENDFTRLPMASVFDYLEEKYGTLPASEKSLRNYIHYLEANGKLIIKDHVRVYSKVPEQPYGKQLQIDFGVYTCRNGLKLYIFAAVLSASRYKYVGFQAKPFTVLDLILCLLDCFDFLEGLPEEIVIDQDSIMVVSENSGDITYTRDFACFIEEMGLKMYVCRKADPETKGKIENVIKYIKNNFLAPRSFADAAEANERVLAWLSRRANGKLSQATRRIPAEVFQEEKRHLRPLRNSIYRKNSLLGREERTADDKAFISVSGSLYSLPFRYRKKDVEIYKTTDKLFVFDAVTGAEICCHKLSMTPGGKIVAREHYRQSDKKIKQLRDEVLNLFSLERWRLFAEKNFKTFPRYVRDQCVLAQRYFNGKTDLAFLDCALKFCLEESQTYSMKDLYDTYSYYKSFDDEEDFKPPRITAKCIGTSEARKNFHVATRKLDFYETVIQEEAL